MRYLSAVVSFVKSLVEDDKNNQRLENNQFETTSTNRGIDVTAGTPAAAPGASAAPAATRPAAAPATRPTPTMITNRLDAKGNPIGALGIGITTLQEAITESRASGQHPLFSRGLPAKPGEAASGVVNPQEYIVTEDSARSQSTSTTNTETALSIPRAIGRAGIDSLPDSDMTSLTVRAELSNPQSSTYKIRDEFFQVFINQTKAILQSTSSNSSQANKLALTNSTGLRISEKQAKRDLDIFIKSLNLSKDQISLATELFSSYSASEVYNALYNTLIKSQSQERRGTSALDNGTKRSYENLDIVATKDKEPVIGTQKFSSQYLLAVISKAKKILDDSNRTNLITNQSSRGKTYKFSEEQARNTLDKLIKQFNLSSEELKILNKAFGKYTANQVIEALEKAAPSISFSAIENGEINNSSVTRSDTRENSPLTIADANTSLTQPSPAIMQITPSTPSPSVETTIPRPMAEADSSNDTTVTQADAVSTAPILPSTRSAEPTNTETINEAVASTHAVAQPRVRTPREYSVNPESRVYVNIQILLKNNDALKHFAELRNNGVNVFIIGTQDNYNKIKSDLSKYTSDKGKFLISQEKFQREQNPSSTRVLYNSPKKFIEETSSILEKAKERRKIIEDEKLERQKIAAQKEEVKKLAANRVRRKTRKPQYIDIKLFFKNNNPKTEKINEDVVKRFNELRKLNVPIFIVGTESQYDKIKHHLEKGNKKIILYSTIKGSIDYQNRASFFLDETQDIIANLTKSPNLVSKKAATGSRTPTKSTITSPQVTSVATVVQPAATVEPIAGQTSTYTTQQSGGVETEVILELGKADRVTTGSKLELANSQANLDPAALKSLLEQIKIKLEEHSTNESSLRKDSEALVKSSSGADDQILSNLIKFAGLSQKEITNLNKLFSRYNASQVLSAVNSVMADSGFRFVAPHQSANKSILAIENGSMSLPNSPTVTSHSLPYTHADPSLTSAKDTSPLTNADPMAHPGTPSTTGAPGAASADPMSTGAPKTHPASPSRTGAPARMEAEFPVVFGPVAPNAPTAPSPAPLLKTVSPIVTPLPQATFTPVITSVEPSEKEKTPTKTKISSKTSKTIDSLEIFNRNGTLKEDAVVKLKAILEEGVSVNILGIRKGSEPERILKNRLKEFKNQISCNVGVSQLVEALEENRDSSSPRNSLIKVKKQGSERGR